MTDAFVLCILAASLFLAAAVCCIIADTDWFRAEEEG